MKHNFYAMLENDSVKRIITGIKKNKFAVVTGIVALVVPLVVLFFTVAYYQSKINELHKINTELSKVNEELQHEIVKLKNKLPVELPIAGRQDSECVKRMAEWIYRNSSRISRRTALVIARAVSRTSKPLLILSIIKVESGFNPAAVSKAGAIGLGQILPSDYQLKLLKNEGILKEKRDLFDVETNVRATEYMFEQKLKKHKTVEKALYAYVGGSRKYIQKVLTTLGNLYAFLGKHCVCD